MRVSIAIGIVGGLVDIASGFLLLVDAYTKGPTMAMMGPSSEVWGGLLLLALGAIVLLTTLLMTSERGMRSPAAFRVLMLVYGVVMLIIGAAMIAQLYSMTSGSFLSGGAMIAVGAAMLVSAASMGDAMGRAMPPRP